MYGPKNLRLRPVFKTIATETVDQNCRNYMGYAGHQNLKKSERATIHFDGEQSFEADFGFLFISMLYHQPGIEVEGDAYWLIAKCRRLHKCLPKRISSTSCDAPCGIAV